MIGMNRNEWLDDLGSVPCFPPKNMCRQSKCSKPAQQTPTCGILWLRRITLKCPALDKEALHPLRIVDTRSTRTKAACFIHTGHHRTYCYFRIFKVGYTNTNAFAKNGPCHSNKQTMSLELSCICPKFIVLWLWSWYLKHWHRSHIFPVCIETVVSFESPWSTFGYKWNK